MSEQWEMLPALRIAGECLADAKKARVSAENRAKRGGVAVNDLERAEIIKPALDMEDQYERQLMDAYRQVVPAHVREWAADIPGLGSGALFARIISAIGHPHTAVPHEWAEIKGKPAPVAGEPFERSLRQLWQYCGCGDPETNPRQDILGHSPTREDKLRGGKRTTVRPLLFTFSSYLVRMHTTNEKISSSHFYGVFEDAKKAAAENRHVRQCQNKARPPFAPNGCGTFAHPEWGEPGSLWRKGHVSMHAHRIVHKEFLRELWVITGEPQD
jgi:hypothetical protein